MAHFDTKFDMTGLLYPTIVTNEKSIGKTIVIFNVKFVCQRYLSLLTNISLAIIFSIDIIMIFVIIKRYSIGNNIKRERVVCIFLFFFLFF